MVKKKKIIVHIGMSKMLCGISDKHVNRAVWTNEADTNHYERYCLRSNERLCHKCKYIHKMKHPLLNKERAGVRSNEY